MNNQNIKGKKILVIGSDSKIAEYLLKKICNRNDHLTTISRNKISPFKSENHFCIDLSSIEEVKILCKKIEKLTFDVFLYFPGSFNPKEFTKISYDEIIKEININLNAAICFSLPVLRNMRVKKSGMMLFLGSSSSYVGFKNTSIYCSSKHGLLGFIRSIADEYREIGIKIACISPGSVKTKMSIPLHINQNPDTFIDPVEISKLIEGLIYNPPKSMWQEEIILKRINYS